jgi:hypothetical protein
VLRVSQTVVRADATGRRVPVELIFVASAGAVAMLTFVLVDSSLIDDAYINLSYARNLAVGLHWGLIPDEVANTATSPLNVILIALATAVLRPLPGAPDAVLGAGIVAVAASVLLAWAWTSIARRIRLAPAAAAAGVALVLLNPILLSSVGLEFHLIAATLTGLLAAAVAGRPGWFGLAAGLAVLTRLDLAVFPLAIALATPAIRARWRGALTAAAAVAAPWFVFSWLYFGSALPDTILIKMAQRHGWGPWHYFEGPRMYASGLAGRPAAVAISFAPAALGAVALAIWAGLRWLRPAPSAGVRDLGPAAGLGAGGVAYYLVLSLVDPGPFHWYYVAPIVSLATFLSIAVGAWHAQRRARPARTVTPATLALVGLALLAGAGVARDLSQGVPWREAIFTTNWARPDDYERVGRALRETIGDAPVASHGEIGTIAYYCECQILDVYSSRPETVRLIDHELAETAPLMRSLLDVNYLWLRREAKLPRIRFALAYGHGLRSGTWPVWSRWRGRGHIRLASLPYWPVAKVPEAP